jgi:hypothetical protein
MKSKSISKRGFVLTSATALCSLVSIPALAQSESKDKRLRIGTFDSRMVAVGFFNSGAGQKMMAAVKADYDKAKDAKDDKRMKEIGAKMQTKQRRLHEQAFSTASVVNLLQSVKAELPGVAKAAGVDLIVSKWEVMFQAPEVEIVDVTKQMAKLFNPSAQGLKWIEGETPPPIHIDDLPDDVD